MSGKGHGPETPWDSESQLREEEDERRHRSGHSEVDRTHEARPRPETERHHAPRRPDSTLPHTAGKVSLEEILERNPKADRRRAQRSPRAQLFVTISHWAMTLLLVLNLISGMRIGWGYQESPLGGMTGALGALFQKISPVSTMFGINLILLHVWSAFALLFVAGTYIAYMVRSRSTQRLTVTRADLRKLMAGLLSGHFWRNKPALWSANVLVYWTSFVFIAVLAVTGFAMYRLDLRLVPMLGGYDVTRLVHASVAYLLIPYVVLHSVLQWFFGRFWTIFKVQIARRHVLAGLAALGIALPIAAATYLADEVPETLTVRRIVDVPAPVLDGDPSDPIWALASPVTVRTAKATNAPGHVSDITVRAVYDGTYVYFQFQWDDPDASYKRYPLMKTEGGWKVLHTPLAFEHADENVYYEDKLSIYITDVKNGSCATTCHIGTNQFSPTNEKHGLHYTENGEYGDVWHWKSIRTNHMGDLKGEPGWADDM